MNLETEIRNKVIEKFPNAILNLQNENEKSCWEQEFGLFFEKFFTGKIAEDGLKMGELKNSKCSKRYPPLHFAKSARRGGVSFSFSDW